MEIERCYVRWIMRLKSLWGLFNDLTGSGFPHQLLHSSYRIENSCLILRKKLLINDRLKTSPCAQYNLLSDNNLFGCSLCDVISFSIRFSHITHHQMVFTFNMGQRYYIWVANHKWRYNPLCVPNSILVVDICRNCTHYLN